MQAQVLHLLFAYQLWRTLERHNEKQELALPSLYWLLLLHKVSKVGDHNIAKGLPHLSWWQPKHPDGPVKLCLWLYDLEELQWASRIDIRAESVAISEIPLFSADVDGPELQGPYAGSASARNRDTELQQIRAQTEIVWWVRVGRQPLHESRFHWWLVRWSQRQSRV